MYSKKISLCFLVLNFPFSHSKDNTQIDVKCHSSISKLCELSGYGSDSLLQIHVGCTRHNLDLKHREVAPLCRNGSIRYLFTLVTQIRGTWDSCSMCLGTTTFCSSSHLRKHVSGNITLFPEP